MRAFISLGGFLMMVAGFIGILASGVQNGWGLIAFIGVGLLALDLHLDKRAEQRAVDAWHDRPMPLD